MSKESSHQPRSVAILVDGGSNPFEFACACEIFGASRRAEIGYELYRARVVSAQRSVRMRDGLFTLTGAGELSELDTAHTIVVPNRPDVDTPTHRAVLAALAGAHARGARLVGLCTGAFTLAEAGLLDGRPAAVHWQLAAEFAHRHPDVDVRPDELYVDDGDILTSAGSAAALDLALHIVRTDHGADIANHVSRRLVFAGFRDGGQRQFVEQPVPVETATPLSVTLDWARDRLDQPLTVATLAAHAQVSPATLHRRFRAELGTSPLAWLTNERITRSLRLLEHSAAGMDTVARRSGLGTATNMRMLVRKRTGLTPTSYRAQFSSPAPATVVR